ncbi:DNRLRE domain-containing protein [Acrocarpospora catenulata]|uniref:DNRLRE domain-containing protein n=1 Tax=Acrocarpospora catenulata TaxID=2836182 RepID=UPI001BDA5FEE|nr:DNRLRE domain-containing protein [Acrocarpospora catenulata]
MIVWPSLRLRRVHPLLVVAAMTSIVSSAGLTALPAEANSTTDVTTIERTFVLSPVEDVDVSDWNDENSPAGNYNAHLFAGTYYGHPTRALLRFDTGVLPLGTVTSATLSLSNTAAPSCGPEVGEGIQVRRVTSAWIQDFLHWGNKPDSTTEDAQIATKGVTPECETWPGRVEWQVTGIVQDWVDGAENHGLVLQSPTEDTSVDNYRWFWASENPDQDPRHDPPVLTVTVSVVSAPRVIRCSLSPVDLPMSGGVLILSLTPSVGMIATDPAGGAIGEVEIEHDPAATGQGAGQVWSASAARNVTVPPGVLQNGWDIRWRCRAANPEAGTHSDWRPWQYATVDVPAT